MGATDSNCCGNHRGLNIRHSDVPDSNAMGRMRRFSNLDTAELIRSRSHSLSQREYYSQSQPQIQSPLSASSPLSPMATKHTIEIKGNITVSGIPSHSLPYGVSLNINSPQTPPTNNENIATMNMPVDGPTNWNQTTHFPLPIPNHIQKPNSQTSVQTLSTNQMQPPIENNENEESEEEISVLSSNGIELDSTTQSTTNSENEIQSEIKIEFECEDNGNKSDDMIDLDTMQPLKLKESKTKKKVKKSKRKRKGHHLLQKKEAEKWDDTQIEALEIEMLREMRRLSLHSNKGSGML